MNIFRLLTVFLVTTVFFSSLSAVNSYTEDLSGQASQKLNKFMSLPAAGARSYSAEFSDNELLEIWNAYKQSKEIREQRLLWLIEEYESRRHDRIAQERLIYLFLALIFMNGLVWLMMILTYRSQKKVERQISEN